MVDTLAAFWVDRHLASASVVESIDKELEVFMRVLLFMPCEILGQPVSAKPSKKSLDRKAYWLLLPRLEEQVCKGVPRKAVASPQFLDCFVDQARYALPRFAFFGVVAVG